MPRSSILSVTECESLPSLSESEDDLIGPYTFNESDLPLILQRRGDANCLDFAVQLCLLSYSGFALASDSVVAELVIQWVTRQVGVSATEWTKYGKRDETRREHFQELHAYLSLSSFGLTDFHRKIYLTSLSIPILRRTWSVFWHNLHCLASMSR